MSGIFGSKSSAKEQGVRVILMSGESHDADFHQESPWTHFQKACCKVVAGEDVGDYDQSRARHNVMIRVSLVTYGVNNY